MPAQDRVAAHSSWEADVQREDCEGIWVPLVTPFDARGELELGSIAPLVDWLVPHGIRGILVLGTTGESSHLADDEADAVVGAAVTAARGRVPILAGAGRASTRHTMRAVQRFAGAGASGVLVMTPAIYRARMTPDVLRRYFDTVADAAPVPVFVYHIPEVTGLDLAPETLDALLEHENVRGFKDSSTSGGPLASTLRRSGRERAGWVGAAPRYTAGYDAGAAGAVLAVAHAIPATVVALDAALRRNDREVALRLQAQVARVSEAWAGGWAVAALKQSLRARGLPAGFPRAPLVDAPAEVEAAVTAAVEACA